MMMPSISEAYTLFIEGIIQVVVGVILLITVMRRGKNRMLTALAWFFIAIGIFSLGPFLPAGMKLIPGISALIAYSSVICHSSVFFGVAGYCSAQFGLLKGSRTMRWSLFLGLAVATVLTAMHILSLPSINLDPALKMWFMKYSEMAMFILFVVSLLMVIAVFFSLGWQMRKDKGTLNYAATTGLGLTMLLAALTIRKALDVMMPNVLVDALTFLSVLLVIIGTTFQTSTSMAPGIVYNASDKKPVAKAMVRIFRIADNKLLESRMTGADGRYGLLIEPGKYRINVVASGFAEYNSGELSMEKPTLVGLDVPLSQKA